MSDKLYINTSDLDLVFISYDEPNAEENFAKLKVIAPWARRIHGVKGSDAAHKAAANLAHTSRIITVDGDNEVHPSFFNQLLELDPDDDRVFSWRGLNVINNLHYGNGGIKCWPVEHILEMRTHEAADDQTKNKVEFCWNDKYVQMWNIYSTTKPNGSPFQAWRAGYREGIKLCLREGERPELKDFVNQVHKKNWRNLKIWMTVGDDVPCGAWAMLGARQGLLDLLTPDFDYQRVQDFAWLELRYFESAPTDLDTEISNAGKKLEKLLGVEIATMNEKSSRFFKEFFVPPAQEGFMTTEMEVIRRIEKW